MNFYNSAPTRSAGLPALALAALIVLTGCLYADSPATALHITNTDRDTEGLPTYQLDWDAASNATYLVQSATSLAPGTPWTTLDAVSSVDRSLGYQGRLLTTDGRGSAASFYRLILPQPQIFSVEPAIFPPGVAVDLSVMGQCFESNDVVQLDGAPKGGVIFYDHSLLQFTLSPPTAGLHLVQLVRNGQVVASFTVVCADSLVSPELVLQGPPDLPPAAPEEGARLHQAEVLRAQAFQDRLAADGQFRSSGNGFQESGIKILTGSLAAGFDVAEGKKGLNAVNVKLACTVGGIAGGAVAGIAIGKSVAPNRSDRDSKEGVVLAFSGEVEACAVDLAIPGRELDFVWARTYHSRLGRTGTSANGWTFSYEVSIQPLGGDILIHNGTGRADRFAPNTNDVYTCPEFFSEGTLSNTTFTLTFADTGRWVFNPTDAPTAAGKLHQIITRNGNTMTLGYDSSGRLAQIVDDLGRTNTVAYDTSGRLASVTDFSGRTVTYQYYAGAKADNGSVGDLKSVTSPPVIGTPNGNDFPTGKTTSYTYTHGSQLDRENHLLLTVTDPKGQTASAFTYGLSIADPTNYLRCVAAQEGSNPPFTYRWALVSAPAGSRASLKCIANDPVGNVTEDYFDTRGRCVAEREFTGRATPGLPVTDSVNRPTGKLRQSDPDYYETQWTWNNDSLCTAEISPGGSQVRCVYQSDFDPATPARKRADCRVVREIASSPVDLDGDGLADTSERVSRFEYDTRFGSDLMAYNGPALRSRRVASGELPTASRGKKLYVGNLPFSSGDFSLEQLNNRGLQHWGNRAEAITFGREKLKATTKTQGDFNLSNRGKGSNGTVKGLVVPDGNGVAIKWKGTGADANRSGKVNPAAVEVCDPGNSDEDCFVTSATDPRGNMTTADYDTAGNCLRIRKRPEILYQAWDQTLQDFAYDPHGQVTAITNAPDANGYRRVDTFAYSQGQVTQCVVDAGGLALTENYEYDARGNLTRCVDPRGNDSLFTYNALDQCVRAQSPINLTARCATDFAYDANDNLVACTTQLRDAADNLVAKPVDRASYDSLNQLTELALAMDATHALTNRFVYDASGQCVQALGPDAVSGADPHQTVTCAYDERGLLFQTITAPGGPLQFTTRCDYDANGHPTRVSTGLEGTPSVTTVEYDGFVGNAASGGWTGLAVKTTSKGTLFRQNSLSPAFALGRRELVKHLRLVNLSNSGRLSRVTDPMGNVTTFNYDANDNLKVARQFGELNDVPGTNGNVRLAESHFEYDGLDRCFRTHDLFFNPATQSPLGSGDAVSACVLAPNGECVSVTDSLGRTTSFGYDTAGRATSALSTGAIAGIVVARDAFGNVTSSTETDVSALGSPPQAFTTTYAYDRLNRCVSASDNVGNTATCAYDSLGRVVRETNPNGNDTTYAYDLLDNCLASADYTGSSSGTKPIVVRTSHATYDTSSRCLTSTDPNGNPTSYAYDSLGHCTNVVIADGTRVQKRWLPANFRTIETDPNDTTITNLYDLCDRLIHRDIATGGAALATTTFETFAYDGCDRLVLANNDVSSVSLSYNSLGDCTGGSQDGLAQSATYDSEGNQLSLTYPGGRVVAYTYDVLDQVTNVSTTANGVSHPKLVRFAYAGPGRLAGIARDNGINTRITWNGLVNPANSAGDYGWQAVSRVHDGTVASPSLVCNVTNTYSRTQSKLTRADAGRTSLTLTYDALEQLIEASDGVSPRDTMYALDAAGNRLHVITNGFLMTPDYALNNNGSAPFDLFMNRYTTTPFGDQSYDANGNLVMRASAASLTFYLYDYADRLVAVQAVVDGGTGMPVTNTLASFTYDALGNRTSKTTYPGMPLAPVTTQYVSDVVTYKDGEDGVSHTRPGNHKPGKMRVLEERVGTSVSRAYCEMTAFTATGEPQYYHCDDQGNVLALTDVGGHVLERYAYDDYGQAQFLDPNGAPLVDASTGQPATFSLQGNAFLFQGMEWDPVTGLYSSGKVNPLYQGGGSDNNPLYDPLTGRAVRGKVKDIRNTGMGFADNNPWSGSGIFADEASDGNQHFAVSAKWQAQNIKYIAGGDRVQGR